MSKKLSAALLITDGENVLLELATGRSYGDHNFDLPKGEVDKNEAPIDAAIRETYEETSLDYRSLKDKIVEYGTLPYSPKKNIYLCALKVDKMPDLSSLQCLSFFKGPYNKDYPEVATYEIVSKDLLRDYLYRNWSNTLTDEIMSKIFS